MFNMLWANRRDLLTAPLLAAMPAAFWGDRAKASPIDQNMTSTMLPDQIVWQAVAHWSAQDRRAGAALGQVVRARSLLHPREMVSGVHERAALVRDRPPVRRGIRDLVGGEWGRLRAERHGSDGGGKLHPARCAHAALRRRKEGRSRACGDRDLRHGTDHLSRGQCEPAESARTVSDTAHTPISSEVQNLTNTIAGFTESFTTQVLTAVTSV